MFDWIKRYWPALFFFALLVAILDAAISSFVTCHPITNQSGSSANPQEAKEYCTSLHGPVLLGLEWIARIAHEYEGLITAAFTVVLAVFTGRLWASTEKLWNVTDQSVKLGNKEFIATHRPKIVVRFIQGPFYDGSGFPFVWITLVNKGETDGTIVAMGRDLARRVGRGGWLAPGVAADLAPVSTPILLKTGERVVVDATMKVAAAINELSSGMSADAVELCAVGTIQYRDENDRLLETGFLRIHDGEGNFVPSDNPEDEYQD